MNKELKELIDTIAEYEGYDCSGKGYTKSNNYVDEQGSYHETSTTLKEVHYHDSWDWLMPVAKRVCDDLVKELINSRSIVTSRYLAITGALNEFNMYAVLIATHSAIQFLKSKTTDHEQQ